MPHRHRRVLPNNLVFDKSHEFGIRSQINEVKKINRQLNFSKIKIFALRVLHVNKQDDLSKIKIMGKLAKFSLIQGIKIKKN